MKGALGERNNLALLNSTCNPSGTCCKAYLKSWLFRSYSRQIVGSSCKKGLARVSRSEIGPPVVKEAMYKVVSHVALKAGIQRERGDRRTEEWKARRQDGSPPYVFSVGGRLG